MVIGERLRHMREEKGLSQGDIERRTGLLRCYISRVENGHTIPAVDTLEKLARALEVPLYQLFSDHEEPAKPILFSAEQKEADVAWGSSGQEAKMLRRFRTFLARTSERDQRLLLLVAQKMAHAHERRRPKR